MAIGFIYSNCVKTFWTILSKNDEAYSSKDTLQLLDSFYDLALNNLLTTDELPRSKAAGYQKTMQPLLLRQIVYYPSPLLF